MRAATRITGPAPRRRAPASALLALLLRRRRGRLRDRPPAADRRARRSPKPRPSPTTASTGWAGASTGHPLAAVDGLKGYISSVGDSVYYGDCVQGKGIFGGGSCLLPLQVTTVIYQPALQRRARPAAQHRRARRARDRLRRRPLDRALHRPGGDRHLLRHLRPRARGRRRSCFRSTRPARPRADLPPPIYCPGLSGATRRER